MDHVEVSPLFRETYCCFLLKGDLFLARPAKDKTSRGFVQITLASSQFPEIFQVSQIDL